MLNKLYRLNKRAEVSETISWIVATVIIIFVLLLFVFISSLLAKAKSVQRVVVMGSLDDDSKGIDDLLIEKTEIAYNINDKNKNFIEVWINQNEKKS